MNKAKSKLDKAKAAYVNADDAENRARRTYIKAKAVLDRAWKALKVADNAYEEAKRGGA